MGKNDFDVSKLPTMNADELLAELHNTKRSHLRIWVDDKLFKGESLFGYSPFYIIIRPWKLIEEIYYVVKWGFQRMFRGWDDRVIWSIAWHLAENMPKWLAKLKKYKHGVPMVCYRDEDYNKETGAFTEGAGERAEKCYNDILDKISLGFQAYITLDTTLYDSPEYKKLLKQKKEGLALFIKYFDDLWD